MDNECTTFKIEITFPYSEYLSFSQEKKNSIMNYMKKTFCKLNAISGIVTFYKNFLNYIHFPANQSREFIKTDLKWDISHIFLT